MLFLRYHPQRSALVRQLASCLPAGSPASAPADAGRQDVAERLGQWLNVVDAIALSSAHGSIAAAGRQAARTSRSSDAAASVVRLQAELARVRSVLTQSITTRHARHKPDPDDLDTEFMLGLQRYQDEQRRMELSVDALREHTRQTLAQGTPDQARLAALDAALAQMLGGREQRLLNNVPAFLKARWTALRRSAAQAAAAAPNATDTADTADTAETAATADPSDPPRKPDTSAHLQLLHTFNTELEHTLLAELEHRLLPVTGLIESLEP